MDLRTEKSKKAITEAFLALRARRPLEKITVRELCQRAQVNRSTFYAHFQDVYDLSDRLENAAVQAVLDSIAHPEAALQDTVQFTRELFAAFAPQERQLNILFSGSRQGQMCLKIAAALMELIYQHYPERRDDLEFRIALTFRIYGGYYAFQENRKYGEEMVIELIGRMAQSQSALKSPDQWGMGAGERE